MQELVAGGQSGVLHKWLWHSDIDKTIRKEPPGPFCVKPWQSTISVTRQKQLCPMLFGIWICRNGRGRGRRGVSSPEKVCTVKNRPGLLSGRFILSQSPCLDMMLHVFR